MENLKCVGCGMEMKAGEAMCADCKMAMTCEGDKCKCQACGKEVEHAALMCEACLQKSGLMQ